MYKHQLTYIFKGRYILYLNLKIIKENIVIKLLEPKMTLHTVTDEALKPILTVINSETRYHAKIDIADLTFVSGFFSSFISCSMSAYFTSVTFPVWYIFRHM